MDHPQELEVDEDAEIVERVAAIDVAKATGMVCTRVPHASIPGKRVTKVWEVKATTKGITELAEHLVKERVERVVLELVSPSGGPARLPVGVRWCHSVGDWSWPSMKGAGRAPPRSPSSSAVARAGRRSSG